MALYNVKCPLCGTENKNVDLDETHGYMECEHCGEVVGFPKYMKTQSIPLYQSPFPKVSTVSQ